MIDDSSAARPAAPMAAAASQLQKYSRTPLKSRPASASQSARSKPPEAAAANSRRPSKYLTQVVQRHEAFGKRASEQALKAEMLLADSAGALQPDGPMDRTWRVSQQEIMASEDVDDNTRAKMLDLRLPDKYAVKFTHTGRHLVMGGSRGSAAVIDALRNKPVTELALEDQKVRDVAPLHNYTLFAVAQTKYVYIYDQAGVEVHQLRSHIEPLKLTFLRHHMLLASVGRAGYLRYQDVSTGDLVASVRSKMGPCDVLAQNPASAVLATGHLSGVVAMWAPAQSAPLVKMLCHTGPVCAVQFDSAGLKMITSGLDERVTVWDARMFGKAFSYHSSSRPASALAVSQRGMLAMGCGNEIRVFRDCLDGKAQEPYMTHRLPPGCAAHTLDFRPFEDVLGIGHTGGVQTVVVPGAGEPNFDSFEANPYERSNQRREGEIQLLLDKIPADMIALPRPIGAVSASVAEVRAEENEARQQALVEAKKLEPVKKKMKGRGKIGSRLRTKHRNIWTEEREKFRDSEKRRKQLLEEQQGQGGADEREVVHKPGQRALKRFG